VSVTWLSIFTLTMTKLCVPSSECRWTLKLSPKKIPTTVGHTKKPNVFYGKTDCIATLQEEDEYLASRRRSRRWDIWNGDGNDAKLVAEKKDDQWQWAMLSFRPLANCCEQSCTNISKWAIQYYKVIMLKVVTTWSITKLNLSWNQNLYMLSWG